MIKLKIVSPVLYYTMVEARQKKFKDNNLSIFTVNARCITGQFPDLTTNLIFVRKRFTFIIITESRLKDKINFVLEIIGYKSLTINRVGRTGGGIKLYFFRKYNN